MTATCLLSTCTVLALTTILWNWHHYSPFTDEKTSQSSQVTEPGPQPLLTLMTCAASSVQELLRPKFSASRLTFSFLLLLLQVHNRNLLSLDFDRVTRTEKIYDDHRKFTLRILYDQAGRPSLWSPSSRLNGVNVTYSPKGHIAGIQRGIMSERMEYDQTGRITSRIFADGKTWSYTYLEKAGVCCCPSLTLPSKRPSPVC